MSHKSMIKSDLLERIYLRLDDGSGHIVRWKLSDNQSNAPYFRVTGSILIYAIYLSHIKKDWISINAHK